MIIYNETSSAFFNHGYENIMGYMLKEKVHEKMNKTISASELRSWENSLPLFFQFNDRELDQNI